jgi:hypothetical protein
VEEGFNGDEDMGVGAEVFELVKHEVYYILFWENVCKIGRGFV